jgi:hypothetical protein
MSSIPLQALDHMCNICNKSLEKTNVFLIHSEELDDHYSHPKCLYSWLSKHNHCPNCQLELSPERVTEIKLIIKSNNYENCLKKVSFSLAICVGVMGTISFSFLIYSLVSHD